MMTRDQKQQWKTGRKRGISRAQGSVRRAKGSGRRAQGAGLRVQSAGQEGSRFKV
jgi:hypothetical protein